MAASYVVLGILVAAFSTSSLAHQPSASYPIELVASEFHQHIGPENDWLVAFYDSQFSTQTNLIDLLRQVTLVYKDDPEPVQTAIVSFDSATKSLIAKYEVSSEATFTIRLFPQQLPDLVCLLSPPPRLHSGYALLSTTLTGIVEEINHLLHRHRTPTGSKTSLGQKIQHVLSSLYSGDDRDTCEELTTLPEPNEFIRDYVLRSRPVILRGAVNHWPALNKWSNEFMRLQLGDARVHIKLTPDGEFEGCEDVNSWPGQGSHLPKNIHDILPFPNQVVVRPAPADMTVSEFMDLLYTPANVSAYLEYTSIDSSLPHLLKDISPLNIAEKLEQEHNNIWFGNGRTVGKLHFDPFDNLLCQVSGAKHLTIFAPHHNERLYESHIPEAQLSFDKHTLTFARSTLLESTSMVMSPVNIGQPNLSRFPLFSLAHAISCEIRQGDALYLPSFWWHEVRSKPDDKQRNIAVNYWYKPVLDKRFPCSSCRLFLSPTYYNLVESVITLPTTHDEL